MMRLSAGVWDDDRPPLAPGMRSDALLATVATLRDSHLQARREVQRRLAASEGLRERNIALRKQIATARRRERPAP